MTRSLSAGPEATSRVGFSLALSASDFVSPPVMCAADGKVFTVDLCKQTLWETQRHYKKINANLQTTGVGYSASHGTKCTSVYHRIYSICLLPIFDFAIFISKSLSSCSLELMDLRMNEYSFDIKQT